MYRITILAALLATFALGCEGPVGPAGAQGPQGGTGAQGPQGEQGETGAQGLQGPAGESADGTLGWLAYSGQVESDGNIEFALPSAAGTADNPPAIVAYLSDAAVGYYTLIAWTSDVGYQFYETTGGNLWLEVITEYPGWYYRIVVIYQIESSGKAARTVGPEEQARRIASSVEW